ncbi:MAG: methyltransferase domain-containing protein [Deltaproteobacteria bacterium]|nr:methyltransferase domain-containing protein [Deltaproteobacteria bacterium]MBW2134992.1 methyltransferase domain-containing protein [Deltaproteobacteria bacterium]
MLTERQAQDLEESLRQRYELDWDQARVRDLTLKILYIKDLETHLISQIEAGAWSLENFPYWAKVWESALVLADFMVAQEPVPGHRILELGAGLGFVGLFAAARGHLVTLTDNHPDALAFATLSAYYNKLTNATIQFLDWHHPELGQAYDWLIGSELLCNPKFFDSLIELCHRYLAPGGRVYITQTAHFKGQYHFLELTQNRFVVRYRKKTLRLDQEPKTILFFELRRPE